MKLHFNLWFEGPDGVEPKLVRTEFHYLAPTADAPDVPRTMLETHAPAEIDAKRFQWRKGARALAICFLRHEARRRQALERYVYGTKKRDSLAATLVELVRRNDDPDKNRWLREMFACELPQGPALMGLFDFDLKGRWVALSTEWKQSEVHFWFNDVEGVEPESLERLALCIEQRTPLTIPDGTLNLLVWVPTRHQHIEVSEPGVLPLSTGARFQVGATVSPEAYLYLIWLTTENEVVPLYPWKPGNWDELPTTEKQKTVTLPADGQDWTVRGPRGFETVLLLTRQTSLTKNLSVKLLDQLAKILKVVPQPKTLRDMTRPHWVKPSRSESKIIWRGPDFSPSNDFVRQLHTKLFAHLGQDFELIRGVTVANTGKSDVHAHGQH